MSFWEWFDERKVFAIIVPIGAIMLLHELVLEHSKLDSETITLLSGGIGGLIAAVTLIAQSIYKTGAAEKAQSEALAAVATGNVNPSPTSDTNRPTPPQPGPNA